LVVRLVIEARPSSSHEMDWSELQRQELCSRLQCHSL